MSSAAANLPAGSATGPRAAAPVRADVRIGAVLGQIGLLPAAVQGAFRSMVYDLLSHHRLKVIGNAAGRFPARRRAQQMVASRTYRFSRASGGDGRVAEVVGEGFAAAQTGFTFGGDALARLERGGTVDAGGPMVVPVGRGRELALSGNAGRRRQFRELIEQRRLSLVPRPGRPPLLVQRAGGTAAALARAGGARAQKGLRDVLFAVITTRRTQRPLLGYFAAFDDVAARDADKFDRALALAVDAAGQAKLVEKVAEARSGWQAYWATYRAYIAANPGKGGEARRVAKLAAARTKGLLRNLDV